MENFNKSASPEILGDKWNETAVLANDIENILPEDLSKLDQSKFSPKTRKLIMSAALIFSSLGFAEAQTTYGNNVPSNSPVATGFNYGGYNQAGMIGLSAKDQQKLMLEQAGIQAGVAVGVPLLVNGMMFLGHHHAMKKELKRQQKEKKDMDETQRKLIKAMMDSD